MSRSSAWTVSRSILLLRKRGEKKTLLRWVTALSAPGPERAAASEGVGDAPDALYIRTRALRYIDVAVEDVGAGAVLERRERVLRGLEDAAEARDALGQGGREGLLHHADGELLLFIESAERVGTREHLGLDLVHDVLAAEGLRQVDKRLCRVAQPHARVGEQHLQPLPSYDAVVERCLQGLREAARSRDGPERGAAGILAHVLQRQLMRLELEVVDVVLERHACMAVLEPVLGRERVARLRDVARELGELLRLLEGDVCPEALGRQVLKEGLLVGRVEHAVHLLDARDHTLGKRRHRRGRASAKRRPQAFAFLAQALFRLLTDAIARY
jgi:hypothetical protein